MSSEDAALISRPKVRKRWGNVSETSLWRWERDPAMNFPIPILIGHRKFYRLCDIEAFERSRVRTNAKRVATNAH